MPSPSLVSHEAKIYRQANSVDSEGTPIQEYLQIGEIRGGFGSINTSRENIKGDAGEEVEAALSTRNEIIIQAGDLVEVAGREWTVIGVRQTGWTNRILLTKWKGIPVNGGNN